ncbi:MAG: ABC transporter ATP-binding protein [Armatimonadetes bacterium]|nr:ABC transporter ATP-binding protein [Armatimonadota bacterium]
MAESACQRHPAIQIQNISYSINQRSILRNVSLEVQSGETLAVMGMSGSGKTTLIKCLAGLLRPQSGTIEIEGANIVSLSESQIEKIRLKMGFVFQYAALFDSLTVFENVSFGLRRHRHLKSAELNAIVNEKLALVGLADSARLYPAQLSGGMQKRVGIARALAMEPSILLFDEPTSGLDPIIGASIDNLILSLQSRLGITAVVVSHDVASVFRIADHVALLHDGSVACYGTPDEIANCSVEMVQKFIGNFHPTPRGDRIPVN